MAALIRSYSDCRSILRLWWGIPKGFAILVASWTSLVSMMHFDEVDAQLAIQEKRMAQIQGQIGRADTENAILAGLIQTDINPPRVQLTGDTEPMALRRDAYARSAGEIEVEKSVIAYRAENQRRSECQRQPPAPWLLRDYVE